jgi:hypothetical protein
MSKVTRLTLSLTEDEAESIRTLAELADVSISAYLREAGLSANGRHIRMIADLEARADKAERSLIEIIHTVKRIADGAS